MIARPVVGDSVQTASSPSYPAGRKGTVRRVYEDDFGWWFEVESSEGVIWTLTERQVMGQ